MICGGLSLTMPSPGHKEVWMLQGLGAVGNRFEVNLIDQSIGALYKIIMGNLALLR